MTLLGQNMPRDTLDALQFTTDQFRYIKIRPQANTEFVVFIPQSLVLRSDVLAEISYRYSISKLAYLLILLNFKFHLKSCDFNVITYTKA